MKILMIGLDGVGQRHARNLRMLLGESAVLLAFRVRKLANVVTPTLQLAPGRNVEEEYQIRSFDNLQKALAENPEIAVICNPSPICTFRPLWSALAQDAICLSRSRSRMVWKEWRSLSMRSRAEDASPWSAISFGFTRAFCACARFCSRRLLGNLLAVRATVGEYLPGSHSYEDYRQMYAARADLGGGVILSQIHEFDYLYALFGKPRRLYTVGGHFSNLEVDVEDVASTLMECEFGGRPLPIHLQQDYVQRPPEQAMRSHR